MFNATGAVCCGSRVRTGCSSSSALCSPGSSCSPFSASYFTIAMDLLEMTARKRPSRSEIVEQFRAIAEADVERIVSVEEISRRLGISGRTLARALGEIEGTTPNRYLRALRLAHARHALMAPDSNETVTEVALRFGFNDLGRFSAYYRVQFDETPSATARRRAKDAPAERANDAARSGDLPTCQSEK
jgi:AraC-like DNA-binding protein